MHTQQGHARVLPAWGTELHSVGARASLARGPRIRVAVSAGLQSHRCQWPRPPIRRFSPRDLLKCCQCTPAQAAGQTAARIKPGPLPPGPGTAPKATRIDLIERRALHCGGVGRRSSTTTSTDTNVAALELATAEVRGRFRGFDGKVHCAVFSRCSRASWQVNTKLTRPSKNAGKQRDWKLPAGCLRRERFALLVEVDTIQAE